MKKIAAKQILKPNLIIVFSVLASIALFIVVGALVLLPRMANWLDLTQKNSEDSERLEKITQSISLLSGVDEIESQRNGDLIEKLTPLKEDRLRVVSIIHVLIKKTGMELESLKVISGSAAATTIPSVSSETGQGSSEATTTTTTTPTTGTTSTVASTQSSSYNLNATFKGSYSATLKFIGLLDIVKRAMQVTNISFSLEEETKELEATLEISLLGASEATISAEENLQLTGEETAALEELLTKLTIDASPANYPLGKKEPFR
jgi:hypothetical protein